ncbi:MAG: hypothetical protein MI864_18285 [Pseudomonadales bacterium]|nr:hypothetical protein [Pseudomonadales bacterium]
MDNEIFIDGKKQNVFIVPYYHCPNLYIWNLNRNIPNSINDQGPHFHIYLNKHEFLEGFKISAKKYSPFSSESRIYGQISDLSGRSACDAGELARYINSLEISVSRSGSFLNAIITGSTLEPEKYENRSKKERELLTKQEFLISFYFCTAKIDEFISNKTTVGSEYCKIINANA